MAKQMIVRLTDDLDGGEAIEEVIFAFRGVEYEIDLSAKNVVALEKALSRYISAGRRLSRRGATGLKVRGRNGAISTNVDLSAIRAWGRANGFRVSSRGRVSADLRDAYSARQG
jgi:hypothetical protein